MKKFALAFSVLILILTSCSSSDEEPTPVVTSNKLIKLLVTEDGVEETTNLAYNGDKLVSAITDDSYKTYYTYTGDYITKREQFRDNGVIFSRYEYSYLNGKNTEMILTTFDAAGVIMFKNKTIYTHLANGNVDYSKSSVNLTTNVLTLNGTGTFTYANGNCVSKTYQSATNSTSTSIVCTYDTKLNPLKNMLNFSKVIDEFDSGIENNPLTIVETTTGSFPKDVNITYSYTYNSNNYPLTDSYVEIEHKPATVSPPSQASTFTYSHTSKYFYE